MDTIKRILIYAGCTFGVLISCVLLFILVKYLSTLGIIGYILLSILAIILSFFIGFAGAKFSLWIENKKLVNNAKKVINGEKENKTEIDGKIIEVNRFIHFDKNNEKIIIDLKGGKTQTENGKENNTEKEERTRENSVNKHIFKRRL